MSQRNRGRWFAYVTIGFVLVEVALFLLFIWDLSASQAENRIRAERYSDEYATQAQQRISDVCPMPDHTALAECIRQIVEATHEQQRAEADLAAQRDMAKWALAVVVVSIASLVVGLVGIYFIKRTYDKTAEAVAEAQHGNRQGARAALAAHESADQARRANEIAQDLGRKQVMAYLSCVEAKFGVTAKSAWITLILRNHGQSPARWARVTGTAIIPNLAGNLPPLTYHPIGAGECGPIITATSENVLLSTANARDFSGEALERAIRYHFPFMCDCILEWEDVFGHIETLRFTLIEDMERSTFKDLPDDPLGVKKGQMTPSSSRHDHSQQQPNA